MIYSALDTQQEFERSFNPRSYSQARAMDALGLHKWSARTVCGSKFWNEDQEEPNDIRRNFAEKRDRYNALSVNAFLLALAAAVSTVAQSSSANSQTGASRIALATISDPRNRAIVDVGADDFVIQEAGAAREVLSVRPGDYPIVLVLDTSADARTDFPMIRKAASHFIDRIGQRPIAAVTIGGAPQLIAGFDTDRAELVAKVGSLDAQANAPSSQLEGMALAARTLRDTGSLFSAIIVLSSASLDGSRSSPDEFIASIVDSGAILHVVANRAVQATAGGGFRPSAAIRALAEQSRGEVTTIYSAASFQAALDRLADRLAAEMMIEYLVPVGSKPSDVKVGVRIAGARVHGLGVAPR